MASAHLEQLLNVISHVAGMTGLSTFAVPLYPSAYTADAHMPGISSP